MAAADACPGFPTDFSAAFNVPTSIDPDLFSASVGARASFGCFDLQVFHACAFWLL